jgi:serine/threonine protein kinase
MPSILVLEQDPRSLERIHHTLGAAGWRVRAVQEPEQAFQAATSERPDLVIVGAAVSGAASVAGSFSRRLGGPGVLGLLPPGTSPAGFGGLSADELLVQPFSDQELLAAVQRAGTAPKAAAAAPQRPLGESKLTSHDIFGDVLAEMELADDEPAEAAPAAPPAPVAVAAVAPAPPAPRPVPPRPAMDDDINRKLEQTLSGVLGSDLARPRPAPAPAAVAPPVPAPPRPAAPPSPPQPQAAAPAPPRPAAPPARKPDPAGDDDIDAILNRTLGNISPRPRPAAPPAAPRPAAPPVSATVPPAEGTAVRKAPRTDGGLSELAELTRTFRAPAAASAPRTVAPEPPRPVAPPAPAASPAPVPAPPPVQAAVPPPLSAATPLFDLEPLPDLAEPAQPLEAPPPLDPPSGPLFGTDPFDLNALDLPPPGEPEPEVVLVPEPELETSFELVDLEDLEAEVHEIPEGEDDPDPEPEPVAPAPPPIAAQEPVPTPAGADVLGGGDFAATQRIPVVLDDSTLNIPGAERFGQYTLLEKIAAGGMAEVWKARMRGVEGFQKTVAIKKILPHMTDNSEFIGMFIDEAKLAAQLSHPNIVHIYDLGKIGRDYYIAMEYVEGKDLRSLLNASRRKGTPLSLGLALLIASRLASSLDYAHRKRDFEGKELGLVHRDVSPQNVLLTREGDVKLCDFGIAKAVSKAGQTQMGSLKGKLQYMSPEQAWGRPVDSRSDIFSLGAVLFEMLTGERLFSGDSEMSILEAVRQGRIRTPRDIDPGIPAEVDEIVTRALAYDVRDRFQSAGEMMQRIEAVLHTLVPSPGPGELAAFLERATAPEPSSDVLYIPPPPAPVPPAYLPDPEVPPSLFAPDPSPFPAVAEAVPVEAVAPVGDVHVEETGGRRSRLFLVIAIVVLLAAVIATFFLLRGRRGGEVTPGGEAAPPATAAPAAQPIPAPAPSVHPGAPTTAPPTAAPAPAGEAIDVDAILKEELAKREEKLRRKYEAQTKELERELAKAQKEAQDKPPASDGQQPPSQDPPPRPERN